MPRLSRDKEMRQYEVRDALHTLRRAEEIKKDKGLLREVKTEAKKQVAALQKVTRSSRSTTTKKTSRKK